MLSISRWIALDRGQTPKFLRISATVENDSSYQSAAGGRSSMMTSQEIVYRTIDFAEPARLAFDYFAYGRRHTDIVTSYIDWEYQYERRAWIEDDREFHLDAFGNTWVRALSDRSTKGLPHRGVLADSWDALDSFTMPKLSTAANNERVRALFAAHPDKFKSGCTFNHAFSILSDMRGFSRLMEDLILEPDRVRQACDLIDDEIVRAVHAYAAAGANGIHIMEDWGTQSALLMSPAHWREFFAPGYRRVCEAAHGHEMRVILHSCGMLWELMEDLIECGIDVLQFDQMANYANGGVAGIERLGERFGGRVTFFCPVDIQHTIVTGDAGMIEDEVCRLLEHLAVIEGGFIAKSYGRGARTYLDAIDCDPAWNDFAFECFTKHAARVFGTEIHLPTVGVEQPPQFVADE
jgi:uroporphyrinogen decarboxylase